MAVHLRHPVLLAPLHIIEDDDDDDTLQGALLHSTWARASNWAPGENYISHDDAQIEKAEKEPPRWSCWRRRRNSFSQKHL